MPMNTNSKELEKQIEALTQLSRDKEIQHVEELSSLRHHYEAMTPDQMWKSQPLERNPPNQNLKVESTNSSTLVELEKQIATLTAHAHELEIKLKESGSERQGLQE
jgi:TFIIF-interacting CTD phosphatase-like protein